MPFTTLRFFRPSCSERISFRSSQAEASSAAVWYFLTLNETLGIQVSDPGGFPSYAHPLTFVGRIRTGMPRMRAASAALNKVHASKSIGFGSADAFATAGADSAAEGLDGLLQLTDNTRMIIPAMNTYTRR